MISYRASPDKDQLADAMSLFEFVGGNADEAIRVAINRTAPKVRTRASQAIRSQVRLAAAYVNERLTIRRATRQNLSGAIQTPSRGILLPRYSTDSLISGDRVSWIKPPPTPPRGIRVRVKPGGPIKPMGRSFFYMVLPKSRALAIVRRRDAPGPMGGKIDVKYGPSLSQVFNTARDDVLPEASEIYQAELLDAMRYLLQKQHPQE